MYTIKQAAELTGFSPDTLRYYEKIGLLQSPPRGPGRVRSYREDDMRQLKALQCLKKVGLSLDDMKDFLQAGQCFANHGPDWSADELRLLSNRSGLLAEHLERMEQQRRELDELIGETRAKLEQYDRMLKDIANSRPKEEIAR